jgi:hypothetical protein
MIPPQSWQGSRDSGRVLTGGAGHNIAHERSDGLPVSMTWRPVWNGFHTGAPHGNLRSRDELWGRNLPLMVAVQQKVKGLQ